MARIGVALVCGALSALLATSCRGPTEIAVDVAADFSCADLRGTALTVGNLHEVETKPPALVTSECADGATGSKVGSVVLVPSGATDDQIAFKVVAGFGRPVDDCLTNFGPGCIVARRALRYLSHTSLLVPVLLSSDCNGVACGDTETCAHGKCVPAEVDPQACAAPGGCPQTSDGGSAVDASLDAAEDAAVDAGVDATVDATVDAGAVYHDMTNLSYWTTFDVAAVNPGANRFIGAVFDGRYVYFVPNGNAYPNDKSPANGLVTRYDTESMGGTGFGAAAAWSTFDTSTVNAGAKGFAGATFDGRYIYFVPWNNGAIDGVVTRYDTQNMGGAGFGVSASWTTFDTSTVNVAAAGFVGAAFDGRYVYLVPGSNGTVTRYDTQNMGGAGFGVSASWTTFDIASVNAGAVRFWGATFDGRYVYFVPQFNGTVTRYDTQSMGGAGFGVSASWATFDTVTLDARASGFLGAVFDGRYVYLVPNNNGTYEGVVARYDTQSMGGAAFGASASWATFDIASVNGSAKGFQGGAFDGRYVYFVPWDNGTLDGVVARYDTQFMGGAAFGASASWTTFDIGGATGSAKDFWGAAFDGRYVYFVPFGGSVVARFDARVSANAPALPGFHGSFF